MVEIGVLITGKATRVFDTKVGLKKQFPGTDYYNMGIVVKLMKIPFEQEVKCGQRSIT